MEHKTGKGKGLGWGDYLDAGVREGRSDNVTFD